MGACLNSKVVAEDMQANGLTCTGLGGGNGGSNKPDYYTYMLGGAAISALAVSYPLAQKFVLGKTTGILGDLWIFGWIYYVLAQSILNTYVYFVSFWNALFF